MYEVSQFKCHMCFFKLNVSIYACPEHEFKSPSESTGHIAERASTSCCLKRFYLMLLFFLDCLFPIETWQSMKSKNNPPRGTIKGDYACSSLKCNVNAVMKWWQTGSSMSDSHLCNVKAFSSISLNFKSRKRSSRGNENKAEAAHYIKAPWGPDFEEKGLNYHFLCDTSKSFTRKAIQQFLWERGAVSEAALQPRERRMDSHTSSIEPTDGD